MSAMVPAAPEPALTDFGRKMIAGASFDSVRAHYEKQQELWKLTNEFTRELQEPITRSLHLVRYGALSDASASLEKARAVLARAPAELVAARPARPFRVVECLEQLARAEHALAFFTTGRVASLEALRARGAPLDDDEWLAGLLTFIGDLSQYATRRATAGDVASVRLCRGLADALQAKFVLFDFRNGPLRRKYDGLKYTVKRLEDLLYEQSLVGNTVEDDDAAAPAAAGDAAAPADGGAAAATADGAAADADPVLAELDAVRGRMEAYDAAREVVIKGVRDTQKLSKLAIYSLHRGDAAKARKQLDDALKAAAALAPQLAASPALRPGAYANAMEEWAEARLFEHWLEARALPSAADLDPNLEVDEYVGGLADLTGEIGRFAVAAATRRDAAAVRQCYETDLAVVELLQSLPAGNKLTKKVDGLVGSVRKLETILYELSLAKAAGGVGKRPSSTAMASGEDGGGDGGSEETKRARAGEADAGF